MQSSKKKRAPSKKRFNFIDSASRKSISTRSNSFHSSACNGCSTIIISRMQILDNSSMVSTVVNYNYSSFRNKLKISWLTSPCPWVWCASLHLKETLSLLLGTSFLNTVRQFRRKRCRWSQIQATSSWGGDKVRTYYTGNCLIVNPKVAVNEK